MKEPGRFQRGFSHYLFELIVIVSGITFSFFLNEWRQERRGNEAMRMDLVAIQRNLESDREEIAELLEKHAQGVKALGDLLAYEAGEGDPSEFSKTVADSLHTAISFYPDVGARNAMVASGNVRWLQDPALASALSDYYDHMVPRVLDNNRAMNDLIVTDLLPWIGGLYPHEGTIEEWEQNFPIDIVKAPSFRQRIGGNIPHANWYLELLTRSEKKVETALERIAAHLQQEGSASEAPSSAAESGA
ncbi:MAG: hypothetical protein OSB14_08750 [Planctomycetota bacterium]|nr:hypothetical protein [Planctomycetota bacterium]